MSHYTHHWTHDGVTYSFMWVEDEGVRPDRVKSVAFTPEGKILLVTNEAWSPQCWLPGGGIEPGETPEEALARELIEEANATLHQCVKIGAQRIDSSSGRQAFEQFYWSRVTLADAFVPQHEITERRLVPPDQFVDTLFWGRLDPKAPLLLQRALAAEHRFRPK